MSQRKRSAAQSQPTPTPSRPPRVQPLALTILHPNAAGIDVHSDMHMVCVPADRVARAADGQAGGLPAHVRRFGANSCDLDAIADWLQECGVTTVALESTGVYWIPLFELLEARGFAVWLVEPGQRSRCGARPKTDVLDAQWIQRLAAQGLARTQSALAAFYRRIKGRRGGKGAITATAHKLACLVYRLLKYGRDYVQQSFQEYEQKLRAQQERSLRRKAALLGFDLVAQRAAEPS